MKPFSESRPRPGAPATGVRFDLDAIIDRFQAPLLRYAQQMLGPGSGEAEEVVQDTFIRLHRQVMRHGPHSIDNLPGWLFRVAHNLARDAGRKRRKRKRTRETMMTDPTLEPVSGKEAPPGHDLARREILEAVLDELQRLPEENREILILKLIQGLTLREIGEITGAGPSTLHYRLNRALSQLSENLAARGIV